MDNIVISEQLECLGYIENYAPQLVLIVPDSAVKLFVVYAIQFLAVEVLALQLVQRVAQGIPTFLVQDPGILLVDEIVI